MDLIETIRLRLAECWWPDPTDERRPKRVVVDRPQGRNEKFGYGNNDFSISGHFWDAPVGVGLTLVNHGLATAEHDLMVGLWPIVDKQLGVMQVQNCRERGNRWAYQLGDRRTHLLKALERCLPGWSFASPDGQQKVDYLLYLHGGFTEEEHEDMDWGEWGDGEQVLPRVRRQYDRLPDGYDWGEELCLDGANIRVRELVRI